MKTPLISAALAAAIFIPGLTASQGVAEGDVQPGTATRPATIHASEAAAQAHQGFLYGRVTTDEGATLEGRLRFGGDEEAFWGHYFNSRKVQNPWAEHVPPEQLKELRPVQILGIRITERERPIDLSRPLMVRFGDLARLEARGRNLWVTLKSGTVFHLDRYEADDYADGLRVWDVKSGVTDFDEWRIRSIEFLPTPHFDGAPDRLHGTVRTHSGEFTGFVQWNREASVYSDRLDGHTADGELSLRFDSIRSITRQSEDSARVTLRDGRQIVLSGKHDVGADNRGVYVDDRRYGRVLVSWDAFQHIDFNTAGSGPAYGDFPAGQPLAGSVTLRDGRRLAGRLVYDLDESETTETLDAPSEGVHYTIPFGLVASITPAAGDATGLQRSRVILRSGEALQLERDGDLGDGNAGMLIFVDGRDQPEYAPWRDVERIDFDRSPERIPPHDDR